MGTNYARVSLMCAHMLCCVRVCDWACYASMSSCPCIRGLVGNLLVGTLNLMGIFLCLGLPSWAFLYLLKITSNLELILLDSYSDINPCIYYFYPNNVRHIFLFKHQFIHLDNSLIPSLSRIIFLRIICCYQLSYNIMFFTRKIKVLRGKLTFIFYYSFKFLEYFKGIWIFF